MAKEKLVQPPSGGFVERGIVVVSGLWSVYTLATIAPVGAIAAVGGLAYYFWKDSENFQTKSFSDELKNIMHSDTPVHESIWQRRKQLSSKYPTKTLNRAINSMIGSTAWVRFKPSDSHELAKFGRCFVWVNPDDAKDVKLPIQRLEQLMEEWGIVPKLAGDSQTAAPLPAAVGNTTAPDQSDLLNRLRSECPELLKLIKAPPIRLVGHQRTGKSSFARKLALLRSLLLPGHSIWWATPHVERDNPLPDELNPVGFTDEGKDFASIERMWDATQRGIDRGNQLNQTTVWDEFGQYGAFKNKELLSESLRSLLQEATKHGYFPILIAHGDQARFYPGVQGLLATLKQGTVKVESIGEPFGDFGEMKPTGRYRVTDLDGNTSEFQVPSWLTEDYLLGIVRSRRPSPTPSPAPVPTAVEPERKPEPSAPPPPSKLYRPGEEDRAKLEKLFSLPDDFAPSPAPETAEMPSELHQKLAEYLQNKGEIQVRKLVQNWSSDRGLNTDQTWDLLTWFLERGEVETFSPPGDGSEWIRWNPKPNTQQKK